MIVKLTLEELDKISTAFKAYHEDLKEINFIGGKYVKRFEIPMGHYEYIGYSFLDKYIYYRTTHGEALRILETPAPIRYRAFQLMPKLLEELEPYKNHIIFDIPDVI